MSFQGIPTMVPTKGLALLCSKRHQTLWKMSVGVTRRDVIVGF